MWDVLGRRPGRRRGVVGVEGAERMTPTGPIGRRPAAAFGLRRRQRINGQPFMVAVVNEDLHLAAGTELHLRRVSSNPDGCEFVLQALPPVGTWDPSKAERAAAERDRLDGSAVRVDGREAGAPRAPWA